MNRNETYLDSQRVAFSGDRTKGEAALARITAGTMPPGAVCTGDPAEDEAAPACRTAQELALLQARVADGQLPPATP